MQKGSFGKESYVYIFIYLEMVRIIVLGLAGLCILSHCLVVKVDGNILENTSKSFNLTTDKPNSSNVLSLEEETTDKFYKSSNSTSIFDIITTESVPRIKYSSLVTKNHSINAV